MKTTDRSVQKNFPAFTTGFCHSFFRRFPEGVYEIEDETLDGEELEAEVKISHVMAAPVGNIMINGQAAAEDCDAVVLPVVTTPVSVSWDPVRIPPRNWHTGCAGRNFPLSVFR